MNIDEYIGLDVSSSNDLDRGPGFRWQAGDGVHHRNESGNHLAVSLQKILEPQSKGNPRTSFKTQNVSAHSDR